jgi:alkylated DNA repair dioxygenase AlkB
MDDLFGTSGGLGLLPMQDAEVVHFGHLSLPEPDDAVLLRLIQEIGWRAENITVWGKTHPQPRLIAWFGDEGRDYKYSGISMAALPWTPLLLGIKKEVERTCGYRFNSLLLNYYRNEQDSMGFHSDDEAELGPKPIIASLSLGATRDFVFKHKHRKDIKRYKVPLESGTLILMKGNTQKNWVHGIEKQQRSVGPRINLTFRQIR